MEVDILIVIKVHHFHIFTGQNVKHIELNPIFIMIDRASGTCLNNFLPQMFQLSCLLEPGSDVRGGIFHSFELKDLLLNMVSESYGICIWRRSSESHMDGLNVCHDPYTTVIPIMLSRCGLRQYSD